LGSSPTLPMMLQGTNSSAKNTEREIKLRGTRFRTPVGRRSEQVDAEILRSRRHVPFAGLILGVHGRGRGRRFPCDVPTQGTRSLIRPRGYPRGSWGCGKANEVFMVYGLQPMASGPSALPKLYSQARA
jgi:hypothetical protein